MTCSLSKHIVDLWNVNKINSIQFTPAVYICLHGKQNSAIDGPKPG